MIKGFRVVSLACTPWIKGSQGTPGDYIASYKSYNEPILGNLSEVQPYTYRAGTFELTCFRKAGGPSGL